jgi:hypothetical protein
MKIHVDLQVKYPLLLYDFYLQCSALKNIIKTLENKFLRKSVQNYEIIICIGDQTC